MKTVALSATLRESKMSLVFTRKELRAAFEEAVNDYLATCEKSGRAPQKPYSGKLMLRVLPEVHARVAMMAEAHGMSLNQWAAEVLSRAS
jgi:predicted HicB family RNase H-like nuclease